MTTAHGRVKYAKISTGSTYSRRDRQLRLSGLKTK